MDLERARARLRQERAAITRRMGGLDAAFNDIVEAARDSNLDDEHDTEGSTIAAERSLVSSLSRDAVQRLAAIDQALARVDDGTYGICLGCGAEIGDDRLDVLPAAPLCTTCAKAAAHR